MAMPVVSFSSFGSKVTATQILILRERALDTRIVVLDPDREYRQ